MRYALALQLALLFSLVLLTPTSAAIIIPESDVRFTTMDFHATLFEADPNNVKPPALWPDDKSATRSSNAGVTIPGMLSTSWFNFYGHMEGKNGGGVSRTEVVSFLTTPGELRAKTGDELGVEVDEMRLLLPAISTSAEGEKRYSAKDRRLLKQRIRTSF